MSNRSATIEDSCNFQQRNTSLDYDFKWDIPLLELSESSKQIVDSDNFLSPDKQKSEWSLQCKPNNETIDDKSYISIYVILQDTSESCRDSIIAEPTLRIVNFLSDQKTITHELTSHIYTEGAGWGRIDFLLRSDALDASRGFLHDGKLTVTCKLNIIDDQALLDRCKMLKQRSTVLSKQEQLHQMGEYNDCALVCSDGEVPACKFVLASQSSVFRAMFKGNTHEAKTGRAVIPDFDCAVMELLVKFAVCGKVDKLEELDLAEELMIAADKYEIDELKALCEDEMCNSLSKDNLCARLVLADRYQLKLLAKSATSFIKNKKENCTDFKKLRDSDKLFVTENQLLVFKLFNTLSKQTAKSATKKLDHSRNSDQIDIDIDADWNLLRLDKQNEKRFSKSMTMDIACRALLYADFHKVAYLEKRAIELIVKSSQVEKLLDSEKLFVTEHQDLVFKLFNFALKTSTDENSRSR